MSCLRILRVCEEELVWNILLAACCHPDPILGEETESWMDKCNAICNVFAIDAKRSSR